MDSRAIWVTNHSLARKITNDKESKITTVETPITSFSGAGNNVFDSMDHFVCRAGSYEINIRIIYVPNGTVIAELKEPFLINAPKDGHSHAAITNWKYFVEQDGLYEYQVLANNCEISSFRFQQSINITNDLNDGHSVDNAGGKYLLPLVQTSIQDSTNYVELRNEIKQLKEMLLLLIKGDNKLKNTEKEDLLAKIAAEANDKKLDRATKGLTSTKIILELIEKIIN